MQDEIMRNEEVVDNTDYITAIKELKENSVDRSKYEALKADNKRLLDAVVNGQTVETSVKAPEVDINALRNELFGSNELSNLDYIEKSLKLRNALIEKGERDPFLPFGHNITVNSSDAETAQRVADKLQECVDYAEGDSAIFTNELQRIMADAMPNRKR